MRMVSMAGWFCTAGATAVFRVVSLVEAARLAEALTKAHRDTRKPLAHSVMGGCSLFP